MVRCCERGGYKRAPSLSLCHRHRHQRSLLLQVMRRKNKNKNKNKRKREEEEELAAELKEEMDFAKKVNSAVTSRLQNASWFNPDPYEVHMSGIVKSWMDAKSLEECGRRSANVCLYTKFYDEVLKDAMSKKEVSFATVLKGILVSMNSSKKNVFSCFAMVQNPFNGCHPGFYRIPLGMMGDFFEDNEWMKNSAGVHLGAIGEYAEERYKRMMEFSVRQPASMGGGFKSLQQVEDEFLPIMTKNTEELYDTLRNNATEIEEQQYNLYRGAQFNTLEDLGDWFNQPLAKPISMISDVSVAMTHAHIDKGDVVQNHSGSVRVLFIITLETGTPVTHTSMGCFQGEMTEIIAYGKQLVRARPLTAKTFMQCKQGDLFVIPILIGPTEVPSEECLPTLSIQLHPSSFNMDLVNSCAISDPDLLEFLLRAYFGDPNNKEDMKAPRHVEPLSTKPPLFSIVIRVCNDILTGDDDPAHGENVARSSESLRVLSMYYGEEFVSQTILRCLEDSTLGSKSMTFEAVSFALTWSLQKLLPLDSNTAEALIYVALHHRSDKLLAKVIKQVGEDRVENIISKLFCSLRYPTKRWIFYDSEFLRSRNNNGSFARGLKSTLSQETTSQQLMDCYMKSMMRAAFPIP